MDQPTPTHQIHPSAIPPSPVPDWRDLPDPQRRELLAVLADLLLAHHRRTETDDERRH